ncbi:MAG: cytochrome c [Rhizobiaceae bacterium]|nr:cytochrome c [Rhizobiaceae bacterium]
MIRNIIYTLVVAVGAFSIWKWISPGTENDGKPMVAVSIPELTPGAVVGKELFDANCASCHGPNVEGIGGLAPSLIHKVYAPNRHSDQAFLLAAKNGVRGHHFPFGNMPPVENISDETVKKIVVYIRELQRANSIN